MTTSTCTGTNCNLVCHTIGDCPDDYVSYDQAYNMCQGHTGLANNPRLCTKEELDRGLCCDSGGGCNNHPVWTSTYITATTGTCLNIAILIKSWFKVNVIYKEYCIFITTFREFRFYTLTK